MNLYSYTHMKKNIDTLFDKAAKEGAVKIEREDGKIFVLSSDTSSPLDVGTINKRVSKKSILASVRESRKR